MIELITQIIFFLTFGFKSIIIYQIIKNAYITQQYRTKLLYLLFIIISYTLVGLYNCLMIFTFNLVKYCINNRKRIYVLLQIFSICEWIENKMNTLNIIQYYKTTKHIIITTDDYLCSLKLYKFIIKYVITPTKCSIEHIYMHFIKSEKYQNVSNIISTIYIQLKTLFDILNPEQDTIKNKLNNITKSLETKDKKPISPDIHSDYINISSSNSSPTPLDKLLEINDDDQAMLQTLNSITNKLIGGTTNAQSLDELFGKLLGKLEEKEKSE